MLTENNKKHFNKLLDKAYKCVKRKDLEKLLKNIEDEIQQTPQVNKTLLRAKRITTTLLTSTKRR